eukprot:scaffold134328_cov19-Tisochrysis_lutea.AAC.1
MGAPGVTPTSATSSRYRACGPAGGGSGSRDSCSTADLLASARLMACAARAAGLGSCHAKGSECRHVGEGADDCTDAERTDAGCMVGGACRGGWDAELCGGGGVGDSAGGLNTRNGLGRVRGGVVGGCGVGGCCCSGCRGGVSGSGHD